jgi:histidinol phosphatase-like enzyme (inositol monophosphatase family)
MKESESFIEFAQSLANESRRIIEGHLSGTSGALGFESKEDKSPVTIVDQEVESRLRFLIDQTYPDHGFLGEETGPGDLKARYVWVVDPVDGTKAYITGLPVFGTLIALCENGVPILGVMDFPATNERFVAQIGRPTLGQGQVCQTKKPSSDKIMAVSNPEAFNYEENQELKALRKQMNWAVYGGSSLVYGRLAQGRLDLAVDCGLDPFDYCALAVVIKGAGGIMTDWEGQQLTIHSGHRVVAAANTEMHRLALDFLHPGPNGKS